MVDTDMILKIKTRHDNYHWQDDPFFFSECTEPFMSALGDNEKDVIAFIKDADASVLKFLTMFTEEICQRFPSDEMDAVVDEFIMPHW